MSAVAAPIQAGPPAPRIPVAIVDDEAGVRIALRIMLSRSRHFECVAEFSSADAALSGLRKETAAVVMMDLKMPGIDGISCIRQLRDQGHAAKVVVLSGYLDNNSIQEAARAGADGFLTKPVEPGDLLAALEYCWSGGIPLDASLRNCLEHPQRDASAESEWDPLLSELDNRILAALETGQTYSQIAAQLHLTESVVKKHVNAIYRALGVNNRVTALQVWHQHRRGRS